MSGAVQAGTLDRLRQDSTIRIAYGVTPRHFPIRMVRISRSRARRICFAKLRRWSRSSNHGRWPKDLRVTDGRAVGVLAGTTTEQALRTTLSGAAGGSCLCQWRVDARPRAHYGRREERPRFLLRATADSSAGFRAAERRADPRHPRPYAPRRLRRQGGEGRTAHQHR